MILILGFFLICATVIFMRMTFELWKLALALVFMVIIMMFCASAVYAYEYTPSDVVLIGKVVQHEAGNQSELGKRLVIDTILNRVESESFPNSVIDVINQPGQYCNPKEYGPVELYSIIAQEMYVRTNDQVLWYRTKRYHTFGVPIIKEGSHYFSGGT